MAVLDDILAAYAWFDHPDGPKFVETHRDEFRTSGHWLFLPGAFSSFHKVNNNAELWLIHVGRLLVHVLDPGGSHQILRLGTDFAAGEQPVVSVPAGTGKLRKFLQGYPSLSEATFAHPHSHLRISIWPTGRIFCGIFPGMRTWSCG
jgi:predicted cupin superfamily sugar epimerase